MPIVAAIALAMSQAALGPTPAGAALGFQSLNVRFADEAGSAVTAAGSHPFTWTTTLSLETTSGAEPSEAVKDLKVELPAGLVGTPGLFARCSRADFLAQACPADSAIGTFAVDTVGPSVKGSLYNLLPQRGLTAELGFTASGVPVTIEIGIDPVPPFDLVVSMRNISQLEPFLGATLTVDGVSGEAPFLTLPRSCTGPLLTTFEADSWGEPGRWVSASVAADDGSAPPGLSGCADLPFSPRMSAGPTVDAVRSPTGFDLGFSSDGEGFVKVGVPVQSDVRDAVVALPEGMTVNPAVAAGLGACKPGDLARERPDSTPGEGCPESSKIGTIRVETPLLDESLTGSVFVAQPDDPVTSRPGAENPFDSLLGLYLVVKSAARGVLIDQAAKIEADPRTGRLLATVPEMPQLPISQLDLQLRDGPRSPLRSPAACGAYAIEYRLTPWSGTAPLDGASGFTIDQGCAADGFDPHLSAGTVDPRAASSSPFVLELSRPDGEQNLSGLSVTLPPGLSAKFAGVPLCADDLASSGDCPASSRVGSVNVAVGSGREPLWIPPTANSAAAVHLAGPYKGAPFSFAIELPAQAGPFDLGIVALRAGIYVDRRTAQATVRLDPLPQILKGVPIEYRAIHLELDRPDFIVNPSSCERSNVSGRATSTQGRVASSSDPFQASRCGRLDFEPRLSLRLLGPPRRSGHPSLRATLTTGGGEANVRRFAATLPATELLDNRHIRAVCSVTQFAAAACPAGSVYGHAKAWSRLLDRPLQGPVYLRAGKHRLPDLVASLGGQLQIDLAARVDSVHGRLRTTFETLPDIPLRKFVLTMDGGGRGLFVNTGGLCARTRRASASFVAQNAKTHEVSPILKTDCGAK